MTMAHRLKRKSENWRRKLPRPVVLRDGTTLRLLSDCRDYVINEVPDYEQQREPWQHAASLMIAAAEGGDIEAVVTQFEAILLHQNKIVLKG